MIFARLGKAALSTLVALSTVFATQVMAIPNAARRPLHNLSAGSRLVAKVPILIPANQADVALGSGGGATCSLRMRESKPFDRIISPSHSLTVESTSRAGFSSARRHEVDTTTYVELRSRAILDFACVNPRGQIEASIPDFVRTVSPYFELIPARNAAAEID